MHRMVRPSDLPANPLSIELTVARRTLWWRAGEGDDLPERWRVSADVSQLTPCPEVLRHVGDLSLAIADVRRDEGVVDSLRTGDPAVDLAVETVIDHDLGCLHPELEERVSQGMPRWVMLRKIALAQPWRGQGLGEALISGALQALARQARVAVCRISAAEFADVCPDPIAAELASVRVAEMLERLGFFRWHGLHVVDLKDPALLSARRRFVERWLPYVDDPHA